MEREKTIDENLISITGRFPIDFLLELGKDVIVEVHGSVVKKSILDNQDGTVNIVYYLKPTKILKKLV